MLTANQHSALDKFARNTVKFARSNLTRKQKNVSKKLYKSIGYDLRNMPNSFSLEFEMEEYGVYQDKGVSGKWKKYDTPFSYKSKMPPHEPIFKWVKARGIKFRNNKGKFTKGSQRSLAFLIQRSIYRDGIKPTLFFSKPFEAGFKKLPDEVLKAYGLDLEKFLNNTIQ